MDYRLRGNDGIGARCPSQHHLHGFSPATQYSRAAFSRSGGSATKATGFTLVELMVVLVILGLMSTAVVLTIPDNNDTLVHEAEALATRLVRAREEAILSTRAVEITVTAQGYGFARQSFGDWQPLRDGPFGNVLWPADVQPRLPRGREQVVFHFDPTGAAAERTLTLAGPQQQMQVQVDAAGKVQVDATQ